MAYSFTWVVIWSKKIYLDGLYFPTPIGCESGNVYMNLQSVKLFMTILEIFQKSCQFVSDNCWIQRKSQPQKCVHSRRVSQKRGRIFISWFVLSCFIEISGRETSPGTMGVEIEPFKSNALPACLGHLTAINCSKTSKGWHRQGNYRGSYSLPRKSACPATPVCCEQM